MLRYQNLMTQARSQKNEIFTFKQLQFYDKRTEKSNCVQVKTKK